MKPLALAATVALLGTLALAGLSSTATAGETHYCPRQGPERFDATRLEGKRVVRARRIARRHDCIVRVVKRDGERRPGTDDLRSDRINVVVRDRRVTRVTGVF